MTNPAQYITGRTVQEQMNQLISYVDARAAEVATSAIASDVADVAQAKTDAESARDAAIAAKDTAVSTVSDCVKKTPAAPQTITGQDLIVSGADVEAVDLRASGDLSVGGTGAFTGAVTVPTEATGTYSNKASNSLKVKAELDAYSPMLRTTGNQTAAGIKSLYITVLNEQPIVNSGSNANKYVHVATIPKSGGGMIWLKLFKRFVNGKCELFIRSNGTFSVFTKYNFDSTQLYLTEDTDNYYLVVRNGAAYQPVRIFVEHYEGTFNVLSTPVEYDSLTDAPGGSSAVNPTFIGGDAS